MNQESIIQHCSLFHADQADDITASRQRAGKHRRSPLELTREEFTTRLSASLQKLKTSPSSNC